MIRRYNGHSMYSAQGTYSFECEETGKGMQVGRAPDYCPHCGDPVEAREP